MLKSLVTRSRSIRRFVEGEVPGRQVLEDLVDFTRLVPSAGNLQVLRYRLVLDSEERAGIFPALGWAAYLKDWKGPEPGERPAAYVVICGPVKGGSLVFCDLGIAAQTLALGAAERGLGCCMLANMDKGVLREVLKIPEDLEILLTLALGKPAETVVLEPMEPEGSVRYWRDERGVHHVPKRDLAGLLL
ncbi:nitroreductase family protein [Desulfobotulus sp.]|jgi:nitroreductase|uniref:nitroreductase family protein n=1 Tax=Desulfobotulus sp. TaxID=1940337 RepID=UPI002A36C751|nr:nitroreductase family protein [Desulfobotulus sp.]MDY0163109.1 nitroreductase family protein [Desulfobotulus sp.]